MMWNVCSEIDIASIFWSTIDSVFNQFLWPEIFNIISGQLIRIAVIGAAIWLFSSVFGSFYNKADIKRKFQCIYDLASTLLGIRKWKHK